MKFRNMQCKMFLFVLATAKCVCGSSSTNKDSRDNHILNHHPTELAGNELTENSYNIQPFHSSLAKVHEDMRDGKHSFRRVRARRNNIEDTLNYLVRELASYAGPFSELDFQTSSAQELTLPHTLYSKGWPKKEFSGDPQTRLHLLSYPPSQIQKRRWNRLSIQTRYAPLGTKLVPIRKMPNSGSSLLRYGRSSVTQ